MRDRNLRSGDLHEELGIFLLKGVALVAPVPRQEDVGNDAFATLFPKQDDLRASAVSFTRSIAGRDAQSEPGSATQACVPRTSS